MVSPLFKGTRRAWNIVFAAICYYLKLLETLDRLHRKNGVNEQEVWHVDIYSSYGL